MGRLQRGLGDGITLAFTTSGSNDRTVFSDRGRASYLSGIFGTEILTETEHALTKVGSPFADMWTLSRRCRENLSSPRPCLPSDDKDNQGCQPGFRFTTMGGFRMQECEDASSQTTVAMT